MIQSVRNILSIEFGVSRVETHIESVGQLTTAWQPPNTSRYATPDIYTWTIHVDSPRLLTYDKLCMLRNEAEEHNGVKFQSLTVLFTGKENTGQFVLVLRCDYFEPDEFEINPSKRRATAFPSAAKQQNEIQPKNATIAVADVHSTLASLNRFSTPVGLRVTLDPSPCTAEAACSTVDISVQGYPGYSLSQLDRLNQYREFSCISVDPEERSLNLTWRHHFETQSDATGKVTGGAGSKPKDALVDSIDI